MKSRNFFYIIWGFYNIKSFLRNIPVNISFSPFKKKKESEGEVEKGAAAALKRIPQ